MADETGIALCLWHWHKICYCLLLYVEHWTFRAPASLKLPPASSSVQPDFLSL